MKRIPVKVPWKLSASDEIFNYQGGQGRLSVSVYTTVSGRAHREAVAAWETRHGTAMPDQLYNGSMGQMLELRFEGTAFFCFSGLPSRFPQDRSEALPDTALFHARWDETGICPDPGFYRIEDSPLKACLCTRGESLTHWILSAHDEELHILGKIWKAVPLSP